MAGGGGVAAYDRTDKHPCHDWQTVSILTKRLVAFDCTPESSRILHFWTSEEAPWKSTMVLALASLLLLRCPSQGRFYCSHLILNLIVYLCAKFGALNQRINEIRSGGNLSQPLPQCQTSRFSIPTILWLSNLVAMFPRASGAIMDSNLHVSSHSYASRLRVMDQAETETQNGKFH